MRKNYPENNVKNWVKAQLSLLGVFHHHNLQTVGSARGVPDRYACIGGRMVGIEVKGASVNIDALDPWSTIRDFKPSEAQAVIGQNLTKNNGVYLVVGVNSFPEMNAYLYMLAGRSREEGYERAFSVRQKAIDKWLGQRIW